MKTIIKKIPWLPLLLAALLTGKEARAQDPFPYVPIPTDSAVWYVFEGARYWYKVPPNGTQPCEIYKPGNYLFGKTYHYIVYDTISYKENLYHKVVMENAEQYNCYIRQDSVLRRVYMMRELEEWAPEYILYDFSIGVGDTMYGANRISNNITSVVDSVSYIMIQGTYRKKFYLRALISDNECYQDVWIEGIGSVYGLLNTYCTQNVVTPGPSDGELQCLQTRNSRLYTSDLIPFCEDTTITDIFELITRSGWGIAPNPVLDKITQANWPIREDQITSFELIDRGGQILDKKQNFSAEWITNLTPGVYCLRLNVKNEVPFIQRFIKL